MRSIGIILWGLAISFSVHAQSLPHLEKKGTAITVGETHGNKCKRIYNPERVKYSNQKTKDYF